jgi:type II secretory pathway component PulJ
MRKNGFLLYEVLCALFLLTLFLGATSRISRSIWTMQLRGRSRLEALGKAINAIEGGPSKEGVIEGPRGVPACRFRMAKEGEICLFGP